MYWHGGGKLLIASWIMIALAGPNFEESALANATDVERLLQQTSLTEQSNQCGRWLCPVGRGAR